MKKITVLSLQRVGVVFTRKLFRKTVIAHFLILVPLFLIAQEKTIDKANLAYKYKQYAEAANLYEQVIKEKEAKNKNSQATLNLKTKLAYCYRMNNKMDKAEELYSAIVQDDRAKSVTYLYFGETLMCNGKYEEAKNWFSDYQILEPNDKQAALLAANCDKVKYIEPYFPYVDIQSFPFNSDADDNAPVAWKDGVVFSSGPKARCQIIERKIGVDWS